MEHTIVLPQLSAAFLICKSAIGMTGEYPPTVYEILHKAEQGQIMLYALARSLALVDSERGIPLAECLVELYVPGKQYPMSDYPEAQDVQLQQENS
jgi:hypothetical protein